MAVLALIPVMFVAWGFFDSASAHYDRSLQALANGRIDVAASEAVSAAKADDQLYAYALHAGVMRVEAISGGRHRWPD